MNMAVTCNGVTVSPPCPKERLAKLPAFCRSAALGITVIVVTHERGLVNHFNKRIILLNDGLVIGDGMGSYEV